MPKRPGSTEQFDKRSKPKVVSRAPNSSKADQRRNKLFNSRQIRTSNNDPSFKEGILDIPSFLKSREFEIQQLEKAQLRSKYSASTRCFQSLPRSLRRRTASHNVKRVPKRMRNRAAKEMKINKDSNNAATTAKSKDHIKGKELYKLKLSKKLLRVASRLKMSSFNIPENSRSLADYNLRSRIKTVTEKIKQIETERAHAAVQAAETQDEKDLIFSKLRLNNTMGSYDNIGINDLAPKPRGSAKYAKRQKKFVWLPTHVWHTKRAHMVKRWGYQIPLSPTQKSYKPTHRKSVIDGALVSDTSYMSVAILESKHSECVRTLLREFTCGKYKKRSNKAWNGFIYVKNSKKVFKLVGKAHIFEISQSECTKVIIRLHSALYDDVFEFLKAETASMEQQIKLVDCRYAIGSIDLIGPAALSAITAVLQPTSSDESNVQIASTLMSLSSLADLNSISVNTVMSLFVDDPRLLKTPIKTNPNKFDKIDPIDVIIEVNKGAALNSKSLEAFLSFEGRIQSYANQPTIKQLSSRRSKAGPGVNALKKAVDDPTIPIMLIKTESNRYSLLIPWFWVLPFWLQLNKIQHVSIMGLKQVQQLDFEKGAPSFPKDYPFITAGFIENIVEGTEAFRKWNRIQPGKRINYDKLNLMNSDEVFGRGEIGFPFNCDWNFLASLRYGLRELEKNQVTMKGQEKPQNFEVSNWDSQMERKLLTIHDVYEFIKDVNLLEREKMEHGELILSKSVELYTEPNDDPKILKIAPVRLLFSNKGHPKDRARIYHIPDEDIEKWVNMDKARHANNSVEYSANPPCPHASNLIGFVTSGNFNLAKGCGTGVGYIDAKFLSHQKVVIRNVGESKARLATIELVNL